MCKIKGGSIMFCRNCGSQMDNQAVVCVKCGVSRGVGGNFCPNCGQPTHPEAAVCTNCGVALGGSAPAYVGGDQKSKLAAGLLGIFLGGIGVHNFYLGYTKKALIQLLVGLIGGVITCGIASFAMWVWGLVEGIMILTGKISVDANGVPLKD
jgi:TM2 domain-containing membrane protein YozV